MAVGGLVNLAVLLFQGWEPVGFWTLFGVGIEEGLIMCNYVEFIKSRIAQATPVPNTLGGAGGACTLSVGAIWEPADCGGGVPKSKL